MPRHLLAAWWLAAALMAGLAVPPGAEAAPSAGAAARSVWPAAGQAAYRIGDGPIHRSPYPRARPIASVAKVMTAYLVLRSHPLRPGHGGFVLRVGRRDVTDWHRRAGRGESTVPVRAGERLPERAALAALLLPSANNVAIMLARRVHRSVGRFVAAMNRAAAALGMRHTVYTDPSGFESATRSTPADQVRLATSAMRIAALRAMVNRTRVRIPVAGVVRNTDTLLHHDGFIGIKTGSTAAAGGCLLFRSRRVIGGRVRYVTGVVLGQPGGDLVTAGLSAARRLVDRVAPRSAARRSVGARGPTVGVRGPTVSVRGPAVSVRGPAVSARRTTAAAPRR